MNPSGRGFSHQYIVKEIKNEKFVIDEETGLMWQHSGSPNFMDFQNVNKWIEELNNKRYAGFTDWRLPTLEEVLSLMEPEKRNNDLYIDPVFDEKQVVIWTADQLKGESRIWCVYFSNGFCFHSAFLNNIFVRAVRSVQYNKAD